MAGSGRVLQWKRGAPAGSSSVVMVPHEAPGAEEVSVQLRAAALTPTDALFCSHTTEDLLTPPSASEPFVPGFFFYGEVLAVGKFVQGLAAGETVVGVVSGLAWDGPEGVGGCYRERLNIHFSCLLPAAELTAAKVHLPSAIAHIPPMVSALFCTSSHLRLRMGEVLLLIAPRAADAIFILQRLLLTWQAWAGPLLLVVRQGRAPTQIELERHAAIRSLMPLVGSPTFLDDFTSFSEEDFLAGSAPPGEGSQALQEVIEKVVTSTSGVGVDVALALDVDLAPPAPPPPVEPSFLGGVDADGVPEGNLGQGAPRPPSLLRTLIGALAPRGRLITTCRGLEMSPADGECLWAKEASLSFYNPHNMLLSAARHGALLHGMSEVVGRLAAGELPAHETEVTQFRLFEQFQHALEGAKASSVNARQVVLVP